MSFDRDMILHAASRGRVRIEALTGKPFTATLIAWRPRRSNGSRPFTARIELASGSRLTVPASIVHPLTPDDCPPHGIPRPTHQCACGSLFAAGALAEHCERPTREAQRLRPSKKDEQP